MADDDEGDEFDGADEVFLPEDEAEHSYIISVDTSITALLKQYYIDDHHIRYKIRSFCYRLTIKIYVLDAKKRNEDF